MTRTSSLWKVEGAGNDFILGVGRWADRISEDERLTAELCRRRRGIGADGALALHQEGDNRVRLVYRNRDGRRARFCANGTRCAALAATRLFAITNELVVATDWVEVPALVTRMGVTLTLPKPEDPARSVDLDAGSARWRGALITVGVPHLILPADNVEGINVPNIAPFLRHHDDLGPEGANVSFVSAAEGGGLAIRTWERGVEAETLCCGSAVLAAAHLEIERTGSNSISCFPRSGDTLVVENAEKDRLRLAGPARFVAELRPDSDSIDGI